MLLIADSGSTKCDWMLTNNGQPVLECSTMGFNPYFHDESLISGALRNNKQLMEHAPNVTQVYFYGAGCSAPHLNAIVERALSYVFSRALVHVGHDLDAAAFATYNANPEIACILGTGSNSCYFDGKKIEEAVPALAYILGDEGSGSYYGKRLLADFLYNRLPADLHRNFEEKYQLDKDTIIENVYRRPHANVYLASFMKFFSENQAHTYVRENVREGMRKFLDIHVCSFPQFREVETNFVGSIAWYFEDSLREVGSNMEVNIGRIIKKPIQGLVNYHLKYAVSELVK